MDYSTFSEKIEILDDSAPNLYRNHINMYVGRATGPLNSTLKRNVDTVSFKLGQLIRYYNHRISFYQKCSFVSVLILSLMFPIAIGTGSWSSLLILLPSICIPVYFYILTQDNYGYRREYQKLERDLVCNIHITDPEFNEINEKKAQLIAVFPREGLHTLESICYNEMLRQTGSTEQPFKISTVERLLANVW